MRGFLRLLLGQFLRLCRAVYCWLFGVLACCAGGELASAIRALVSKDAIDRGSIASLAVPSFYTVVFFIAWWTIFRRKRSLRVWGIAASGLMAAPFLPFLAIGAWQVFLHEQLSWFPFMLFGVLGIVAFSAPHHREELIAQKGERPIDGEPANRSVPKLAFDIGRSIYGWAFFANACVSVYWLGIEERSLPAATGRTNSGSLIGLHTTPGTKRQAWKSLTRFPHLHANDDGRYLIPARFAGEP